MEITRQLRKDKLNKKGFAPIQVTICWDGHRLRVATGERVRPEHWNEEDSRVRAVPGSYSTKINPKLEAISTAADKAYLDAAYAERRLPEAELKQRVEQALHPAQESPTPTDETPEFWWLMEQWLDEYGKRLHPSTFRKISPKTLAGLEASRSRLRQFEQHRGQLLTLPGMDLDFYDQFRRYVMDELGQELNTFGKHIRRLKAFLEWCEQQQDAPVNRRYRKFVAPQLYAGVDALTEHELRRIQRLDFTSPDVRARLQELRGAPARQGRQQLDFEQWVHQVELARDKLLECVYTGLRISDADRLGWSHVHGEVIRFRAEKNQAVCYIPYYEDALFHLPSLVARYEHRTGLGNDLLLPPCPKLNQHLATVQQLAGITRLKLTSKLGRKTFVTLKLYQGVPTRLVMQATGHQTEESFNRYVGVDTLKLVQEFMRHAPKSA